MSPKAPKAAKIDSEPGSQAGAIANADVITDAIASTQRGIDRRSALRSMGGLALLLGAGDIAFGASIVAVRIWPAAEYTRVTIESDAPLSQRHFMAENPNRLVIDVDGLELSPALVDEAVNALDQPTMDGLNTYFVSRAAHLAGLKLLNG